MVTFTIKKLPSHSYDKPPRRVVPPGVEYLTYAPPTLTEEEFECLPDVSSMDEIPVEPCLSGFLKVPVTVTYNANHETLTFGIGAEIEIRRSEPTNQIVLLIDDDGMPVYIEGYGPTENQSGGSRKHRSHRTRKHKSRRTRKHKSRKSRRSSK